MQQKSIYLLVILSLILGLSCGADDSGPGETDPIFVFKVDYTTLAFEGGITLSVSDLAPPLLNEIPIDIDKDEADMDGDGAIAIIFDPTIDILFNAALTNDGSPEIFFPTFISPSQFLEQSELVDLPSTPIQHIDGDYSQTDFATIWAAISNLAVTDFAITDNTRIGLFLYQPNSSPNFSENWDWVIFLYDQGAS